ncbi:MAG: aminodeoxychorismate synthase component I, partial [Actinobacteria bacterium]|nr:aminodeoxychorismate synthase component I [Actinomycetota bacterium]
AVQGKLRPVAETIVEIEQLVEQVSPTSVPKKGSRLATYTSDFTKDDYKQALSQMVSYMIAGDIYVANMTRRLTTSCPDDPYDVYRYLRTHNPAPFSTYFNGAGYQICCASMERFMYVRGRRVETRPIKGTRKRGATPDEDEAMRRELEYSEKDRSELLMIVDLERNDLSRVCAPGTVNVVRQFDVEAYTTVFHLVTTIEGYLDDGKTAVDLLEAAFPGGSITGAPKIRAMQIIDELEHSRRGLYTGSIGYISSAGDADFNIVIRTAICQAGTCQIGVGGGITYESDLEFEHEETIQKAKAVLEAIAQGGDDEHAL